jgi:single-strand DNA-binding protein
MSATNINRVVLTGNLTRDPELRSLPSGSSVCQLRIASNTRRKDNQSGQWVDKPNYFDITVFGAQGESCARYLAKGRPVCVDGRLEWREWQDQQGNKRQSVEIVADSIQFLGSPDGAPAQQAGYQQGAPAPVAQGGYPQPGYQQPAAAPAPMPAPMQQPAQMPVQQGGAPQPMAPAPAMPPAPAAPAPIPAQTMPQAPQSTGTIPF